MENRQPWDPDNTTGVQMPGRGGDPRVSDDDLRDIVAYLRELQDRAAASDQPKRKAAHAPAQPAGSGEADEGPATVATRDAPSLYVVDRSYIPQPPAGPQGLAAEFLAKLGRPAWAIPENAGAYFGVHFTVLAVTCLHVFAALTCVGLVLGRAYRRASIVQWRPLLILATTGWWLATSAWLLAFGSFYV